MHMLANKHGLGPPRSIFEASELFVALFPCTMSPLGNRRKVFGNQRALVVYSWHGDNNPSVIAHGEEQATLYTQMPFVPL